MPRLQCRKGAQKGQKGMSFLGRGAAPHLSHASGDVHVSGKRFSVVKQIAEGGFGFISIVYDPTTNKPLVLKRSIAQSQEAAQMARMEVDLLKHLRHPNIIRYEGSEVKMYGGTGVEALLLLEYCHGGHLLDHLNAMQGQNMPETEALNIHRQITSAIEYLHTRNPPIVHRDLKLENVLLAGGVFKLCDFGSCVQGHVPLTTSAERATAEEIIEKSTTQMYRAPEMCDLYMQPVLTEKTDIWALGCILYATCFFVHPFNNMGNLGIINARINIPHTSPYGESMHNLILHHLHVDPNTRASAADVQRYIQEITAGRPIPAPAAQPEPEVQRRKPPPKPAPELKPACRTPKQLDPNSLAARRLAERKGGRQRSSTEADVDAAPHATVHQQPARTVAPALAQIQTDQLAASFDAFGLGSPAFGGPKDVPALSPMGSATFDGFAVGSSGTATQLASSQPQQADSLFDPFALNASAPSPQRQSFASSQTFDPFSVSPTSPTKAQDWGAATSPRVDQLNRTSTSSYFSSSERVASPPIPEALSGSPEDFHGFAMSPCAKSPKRNDTDLFDLFATPSTPSPTATAAQGLTRQRSAPAPITTEFNPFETGNPFQQLPQSPPMQHLTSPPSQGFLSAQAADLFGQQTFDSSSPFGQQSPHQFASTPQQQSFPLQRSVSDGHWMPTQPFQHQSLAYQQTSPHRSGHIRQMTSPAAPGYSQAFGGTFSSHPQTQTPFDQLVGSANRTTQQFSPRF